jgi:hypothetical protein
MHMLEHRLQILLDDERHRRLKEAAQDRGVSVATIVREAIDRGLPSSPRRRRAAGDAVLAAPDMPVSGVADLVSELNELRGRRA